MGRLTEQDEQGNWKLKEVMWEELCTGCQINNEVWQSIYGALCKLKDYENTGLDPQEIKCMNGLEKLLKEIALEHPYKVPGQPETYNPYNEAWQDCIDRVTRVLMTFEN